jgi:4-hydroxy-tetrahydrodipicolinate synthase
VARVDWSGVFVVNVTPFRENGEFDASATRALVDLLIDEGITGLVVAGSTGEWFSMSDEERVELFRVSKDAVGGRVPLLAGISAITTQSAVSLASQAKDLGLDGGLLLAPPYVLPTDRELEAYMDAVAEVGLPIMLYNNPGRTGVNLDVRWLKRLVRHQSIVALKESSKDIHQISAVIREMGSELAVFTGMETYLGPVLQRGGAGVVAMAPNVLGRSAVALYRALCDGDVTEAQRLQKSIDLLYSRMYSGKHNPYVVLKEAMRLLNRPAGHPRLPLQPFTVEERREFGDFLANITR